MRRVGSMVMLLTVTGCPTADPKDEEPIDEVVTDTGTPQGDCETREVLTADLFVGGGELPPFTCWSVSDTLRLDAGTFTIHEGVDVTFSTGSHLWIPSGAQLSVDGTEAAPVELHTGDPAITWQGIGFENSQGSGNRLVHVRIENAGDSPWNGSSDSFAALWVEGTTTLALDHVTFRNSQDFAMQVRAEAPSVTAEALHFEGNGKTAWVSAQDAAMFQTDTTFTDNDDDRIYVGGSNGSDDITEDATWQAVAGGWHVNGSLTIAATWTLAPGARLHMAESTRILVVDTGTLVAESNAEPIVFEAAVPGTKGFWTGIEVQSTGSFGPLTVGALFDGVEVLDAGHAAHNGNSDTVAALFLQAIGATEVRNTVIANSEGYGVWATNQHELAGFADNTIADVDVPVIMAPNNVVHVVNSGSSFDGADPRLHVGHTNTDRLEAPATWNDPGVPLFFVQPFYVDAPLTLNEGMELQFDQSQRMYVEEGGSLASLGTAARPNVFRGANEIADGYWTGLRFDSRSSSNQLTYTSVLHAGVEPWTGNSESAASIYLGANALLGLQDSEIDLGGGWAMWLSTGADFTCGSTPFHTLGYRAEDDTVFSGC